MRGAGLTDADAVRAMKQTRWLSWLVRKSQFLSKMRVMLLSDQAAGALRDIERSAEEPIESLPYFALPATPSGKERPWMGDPKGLTRVPERTREECLRSLIRCTREHGAALILVHPAYPVSRPHRCVLTRVAEQEHVPVLEMEDLVQGRKNEYFFSEDVFHPNPRGHALIAQALADLIEKTALPR